MLKIGTRSSAMARAQTTDVIAALAAAATPVAGEAVFFKPRGDRDQTGKLDAHGGKGGAFVAEIRAAMRDGALQAAMHSLKDVPGDEETPGLVLGAYIEREPPEDVLVLRGDIALDHFLETKGAGLKIGTNAVRRAAYLRRLFPEADVIHFRGAADTRLKKLDERTPQRLPDRSSVGPADALVMARSGLDRIGRADRIDHIFTVDDMLPAVGQGVVVVECAETDFETRRTLLAIDHHATRHCALAERELLWVLNGHCNSPIAGHATIDGDIMRLRAAVLSLDGAHIIEADGAGPADRPRELGRAVGLDLIAKGAAALIEASAPVLSS